MGKPHLLQQLNSVVPTLAETRRCPFAHAVQCQNGCLLERRGEKGTGGVRLVVFGEDVSVFELMSQRPVHLPRQVQLLTQPLR